MLLKKRILVVILLLVFTTVGNSQSKKPWWKKLFKKETVEKQDETEKNDINKESEIPVIGIDTLDSDPEILEIESKIKPLVFSENGKLTNHNTLPLDSINNNLKTEDQDGFRIQIYFGNLNAAKNVRANYMNTRSGELVYLELKAPNYVVVVGNYRNKIEAYQNLHRIQNKYPRALIVESKIE